MQRQRRHSTSYADCAGSATASMRQSARLSPAANSTVFGTVVLIRSAAVPSIFLRFHVNNDSIRRSAYPGRYELHARIAQVFQLEVIDSDVADRLAQHGIDQHADLLLARGVDPIDMDAVQMGIVDEHGAPRHVD